jgi:hypothetical protein
MLRLEKPGTGDRSASVPVVHAALSVVTLREGDSQERGQSIGKHHAA